MILTVDRFIKVPAGYPRAGRYGRIVALDDTTVTVFVAPAERRGAVNYTRHRGAEIIIDRATLECA